MKTVLPLLSGMFLLLAIPSFAQWVQTSGPEGGFTGVIFNDPTSGNIFAGGNGFNKSGDNGATWAATNVGMDGTDSPVAVVRLGSNLFAGSLDRVYISTNNGNSWTLRSSGLPQIISMGVIGNTIVIGTNVFGIRRSTNDGTSWLTVTGLPPSNNIVQTIATVGTRLLAGLGGKGVWTSTDEGASWSQSSTGLGNTRSVNGLAVHGSTVFAATSDSAILKSTNGGTNWVSSSTGMNFRATVNAIGSNGTVLFASVTGAYSGIDTGCVYRSTNDGSSWISVKSGLYTSTQQCIGFGTGGKVFAGSPAGIYATTNNGAAWYPSNTGLRNANALAMTVSGTTLFAGHIGGISKTQDEGATWVTANNGLPMGTGISGLVTHNSYVFAAGGYVYRSSDNGASWIPMNNGIAQPYVGTLSASSTSIYAGSSFGIMYVSTNDGVSWTSGTGLPFGAVSPVLVDGSTLWVGTNDGVYRSTDNGATWTSANTGLPSFGRSVSSIVRNGSNLFAGLTTAASGNVYISTNNGGNWTSASTGIPAGSYLFCLYSLGQFVFAGFNYSGTGVASGIYRTGNNGGTWTPVNDGLPSPTSINVITVMGTNMYASDLGVWKRPLSQLTGVQEIQAQLPATFSLDQNYPNPFNPTTKIRFSLPSQETRSVVSLKVYDVLGREVATLVNEELGTGTYETTFAADRLASGIYFYKVQSGNHSQMKTMLLMK